MTFKKFLTESKSIKCDYVVMHLSGSYSAAVTPLSKKDLSSYFTEDNGFDEDDIKAVTKLGYGQTWSGDDIKVTRIS